MNEFLSGRIAEELAFYRIRNSVSECAETEEGRLRIQSREPDSDLDEIARKKNVSRE